MSKVTMGDLKKIAKISKLAEGELLRRAFDLVAPAGNWKNPIQKVLHVDGIEFHLDVVREAVIFMTGSVPTVEWINNVEVVVRAEGYYAAIGA